MALRPTTVCKLFASVIPNTGYLHPATANDKPTGRARMEHRWDLGEYAVMGPYHADMLGGSRNNPTNVRAGCASFGYGKWRETYEARHLPHVTALPLQARSGFYSNNRVLTQIRGSTQTAIEPRLFTAEELENYYQQALKSEALALRSCQIPLTAFYLETNWRHRYQRANRKERAELDVKKAALRGFKGKGAKYLRESQVAAEEQALVEERKNEAAQAVSA